MIPGAHTEQFALARDPYLFPHAPLVRVDRDVAWAALARDKKATEGRPRLVLLDAPGDPRWGVELPDADVRAALDAVIAG